MRYALHSGKANLTFQIDRKVDENRNEKHTNRYTIGSLFPNEDNVKVLKRELELLTFQQYIETVKDLRFISRSEMRVFGKKYSNEDVYIKIRVELIGSVVSNYIFVMSFHFAEEAFVEGDFPYGKRG